MANIEYIFALGVVVILLCLYLIGQTPFVLNNNTIGVLAGFFLFAILLFSHIA